MSAKSVITSTAIVARGGYSDETRQHPCLAFMEKIEGYFDSQAHSDPSTLSDWYTADFSVITPHGDEVSSSGFHDEQALTATAKKFYGGPFNEYKHAPSEIIAIKADHGWDLYWRGDLYTNVHGERTADHVETNDHTGRGWDHAIPAMYHFEIVEDSQGKHGYKLRHIKFFKDTGVANHTLHKRGLGHKRTIGHEA